MSIVCTQLHTTNVLQFLFSLYDSAKCESYDYLKAIVIRVIRCAHCASSLTTFFLRWFSRPNFCVKLDVAPCVGHNAPYSKEYNVRIVVNR